MTNLSVLFLGMLGSLSRLPLAALLAAEVDLCGLVLPAEIVPPFQLVDNGRSPSSITPIRSELPTPNLLQMSLAASPLALAAAHTVPAFAVRQLVAPDTIATLTALQPDVICVSCFPRRLPPAILRLPRLGCLNVHPSLLPRFRGPAPLFWALRAGVTQTGVTVHFMDEQFDTGDVALQRPFPLQDGVTHAELESSLADIAGDLLVEAVQKLTVGRLPRQPQPPGFASDPWPTDADFELDTTWSARRAFNFMRGTGSWGRPYFIQFEGRTIWLETAVAYEPKAKLTQAIVAQSPIVQIQFSPGMLTAVPLQTQF